MKINFLKFHGYLDQYFVTWEPLLIPEFVYEPMDYGSSKSKNKGSNVNIHDVIEFFVSFIETDQLGRLANAHVAISDSSPDGVCDPRCIELASAFSKAVDFPKTGEVAKMPQDAKYIKIYPDFMERYYNESYESSKIIGKMYRKSKRFASYVSLKDKLEFNPCFVLPGNEVYLIEARKSYESYRIEIDNLMFQFGCETESEVLIGIFFDKNTDSAGKNEFKLNTQLIKDLWTHERKIFFEEFNINHEHYSNLPNRVFLKASAWYMACYTHSSNNKLRILSFPWIFEDILCRFRIKNYNYLSKSIIIKYSGFKQKILKKYYKSFELKQYLEAGLNIRLFMVSSIDLFIFDENCYSRFKLLTPKAIVNYREFKNILEEEDFKNIRISLKGLLCEHDFNTRFSISTSQYELDRYLYIRNAIFSNEFLLPILYVIVHFADMDKIFTVLLGENVNLNVFLIYCIEYFKNKKIAEVEMNKNLSQEILQNLDDFDENDNWSDLFKNINFNMMQEFDIGNILLNFYYDLAFTENEFKFHCPFEMADIVLNRSSNEILKNHFSNCLNYISKVNDISLIWDIIFSEYLEEPKFVPRRKHRQQNNRRKFRR